MSSIVILMCEPRYYEIAYEINPWMKREHASDSALALAQWIALKKIIIECGATVELITPIKGWPDMVFTANAGLVIDKKIFLANFKHPERQGERDYFQKWFEEAQFEIITDMKRVAFEGAGDALFAGKTLFLASGFRSDAAIAEQLAAIGDFFIVNCQLVDPYFYHIDTCFCPLNDTQAIWWPAAFDAESQKKLSNTLELFAVTEEDARKFACNAVVINKQVIIPSGCDTTAALLTNLGFTAHQADMSEYIKAGGACKCLTLKMSE